MSPSLLNLAKEYFAELNEAETYLFTAITESDIEDGFVSFIETHNVVRADRFKWLLSKQAQACLDRYQIKLEGIRIEGRLSLDYICLTRSLIFKDAEIVDGISLRYAQLYALRLEDTTIKQLHADGLQVKFNLELEDVVINEDIQLSMASIGGNLVLRDCNIYNRETVNTLACQAEGIEVGGCVYLTGGPESGQFLGEVCFDGAHIKGDLDCRNIRLLHTDGEALSAYNVKVDGNAHIKQSQIEGLVSFVAAHIGGSLSFSGSHLCSAPPNKKILALDAITVGSILALNKQFRACGIVSLTNAKIADTLCISKLSSTKEMELHLDFATVTVLQDDTRSWPDKNNLRLNGFVYKALDRDFLEIVEDKNRRAAIVNSHLCWLEKQSDGPNYPAYEVLAKALQNKGQPRIATELRVAKRRTYSKHKNDGFFIGVWNFLLYWITGHGYYPGRAFLWALAFIIVGWGLFHYAYREAVITAASYSQLKVYEADVEAGGEEYEKAIERDINNHNLHNTYPSFDALFYSVDTFIPLVDLKQAHYWHVSRGSCLSAAIIEHRFDTGTATNCYSVIHTMAGWIITSLLVAALAGIIKKQED